MKIFSCLDDVTLQFMRLLAPIYSAVTLDLKIESEEELSKSELNELIGLFANRTEELELKQETIFLEFHNKYAILVKKLICIRIEYKMTEQVRFLFFISMKV